MTDSTHQGAPLGVLFMAYGGPESLEDMPGYLADIRAGRVTTQAVLDEITNNYRQIGGKSPLPEFTRAQVEATMQELQARVQRPLKAYIGMRHWNPWIEDAVREMLDDGITQAVAIVLAPHYSSMSVAKYQKKIKAGLSMNHGHIDFEFVNEYHTESGYVTALANRVREGIEAFPEGERDDVHVILSAHSLPVRILREGDPYADQLHESARLIAAAAGLRDDQWSWSYQSAGRSPEPWLGPQLDEHMHDLSGKGIRKVVSVPVGFVSDHVEILFDIDIAAQETAAELGMTLVRPPALNTDPLFIGTLASVLERKVAALS
ncbi:ferrochelatase [Deinococcus actinosclerus]|jgi:ferrochelatase|uniref:Ferrochelatase n=1 Tax=Deinococcus actinosclerus TaxID=1768108 RepID=A0ABM5X5Q6_9DEIO|nr:ferrochelatase [Deinococcus actinosclerus]ALW89007.1 ferrochelatase [Deinococcus actinosclerus]